MDLRAVLVDDEQLARDELGYLLGKTGDVEIIGQAGNGVEALSTINRVQPDVVFLDVQMPGLSGFEVARRMLDSGTASQIIFVTAYDQHAIEAFEVNAVDYLLKPVDPARLEVALQRARRRISFERHMNADGGAAEGADGSRAAGPRPLHAVKGRVAAGRAGGAPGLNSDQLEEIIQQVTQRQSRRERLALKVGERFMLVQAEDIVFASLVDESITVVTSHLAGTSNYRTLDELQERLDPAVFWRVHRSHLVNINKIKEIVPWFSRNFILKMKDEKATEIPVSRTQTRRLREYLKL
jgi:two-component system LytT family response regulator/two-component system response regulator LytT